LIAAPNLALELARHPRGGDVAAVLLAGLTLAPQEVVAFGAMHVDSPARDRARVLAGSRSALVGGGQPSRPWRGGHQDLLGDVLALVDAGLMSGASERISELRVVRHPGAVAIVGDAVLAAWCGSALPLAERQVLNSPFVRAITRLPGAAARPAYDGPRADLLGSLAAVLRRGDRKLWRRLGLGSDSAVGSWARLMHEASAAAVTTSRLRTAASAQLLPVVAVHRAWPGAAAVDAGWNAVSAVAAAVAVADVLPDGVFAGLIARWVLATT
jgi:hypothetical protein